MRSVSTVTANRLGHAESMRQKQVNISSTPKAENILALVPDAFGSKGGIAQYIRDVLTVLCESTQVESVTAVVRNGLVYRESLPEKLELKHPNSKNSILYALSALRYVKTAHRPAAIICGHINFLPLAWMVKKLTGSPIILFIYGIDAWTRPKKLFFSHLIRHVEKIISISELTRQRFLQWAPAHPEQIEILNNCIRLDRYSVLSKSKRLLAKHNIKERSVIMTIARLNASERYKGIDEVMETIAESADELPDLVYLIIGEGDDKERLKHKARKLGLGNNVVFTGWIEDAEKMEYLSIADAFVMPGWGEGFGFVYLEAMACGIPVVASELDGSREAVADGALGEIVNPKDKVAIRSAISRCLKKSKHRPQGLKQFDYEIFRKKLNNIVRGVLLN